MPPPDFLQDLSLTVATALAEDIGSGDITAELIARDQTATATVITRETAVICGRPWVDEVFRQIDPDCRPVWRIGEGETGVAGSEVFRVSGRARSLLTAERCALNFLQTLSGVATTAERYARLVQHSRLRILDTRKTLPGLRLAQKYAVRCGGCHNHRIGLYDAFLIKENHIAACGGIGLAIERARSLHADRRVEIEVESLRELQEALDAGADIVMLDNFALPQIREAVALTAGRAKLEASGGLDESLLLAVAETGVDYVSIGALTKHVRAIDFSLRLD